jgi:hypothetical protein
LGNPHGGADFHQRPMHAAQISRSIIQQSNHAVIKPRTPA